MMTMMMTKMMMMMMISTRDSIRFNFTPLVGRDVKKDLGCGIRNIFSPSF